MLCPHCRTNFFADIQGSSFVRDGHFREWNYETVRCPECNQMSIWIWKDNFQQDKRMVEPIAASRGPVPSQVPAHISRDYVEACNVLPISSKASAALSRRCLQNILNTHGYMGRDLAKQIDALLNEVDASKSIGSALRDTVDAIRNFGNFSAHPIDDQTTLQIIDVDPEEAEWCLQILEEMFDHFYVRPAQAAARKAALNAKLTAAGKPPAK
jgi:hypothetical protein